ncbi:MAG: hypothetical protein ABID87_03685 [Chloroflexota bacterium]
MTARYDVGQRVKIKPAEGESQAARDSNISPYAGQVGEVTNYYWIRPSPNDVFYIYTVKLGDEPAEITLHEDELDPLIG